MGIPVLILGDSGTGKTFSLKNVNPDDIILIQTVNKMLPFRSTNWKPLKRKGGSIIAVNDFQRICAGIESAASLGKSIVVIDDFQYMLAMEFMSRAKEVGFSKFTEIAQHVCAVIETATKCAGNTRVYFLSHTETSESGKVKIKTIGKMLDEKITPEGLFTVVLRTSVEMGKYYFATQNNGSDTVKSPEGMFDHLIVHDMRIPNDLAKVDLAITDYIGIDPANHLN